MNSQSDSSERLYLSDLLRKLWEQYILWTRQFIISSASDLPDLDLVTQRLLRNPSDFAHVFRYYYGEPVASDFEQLLRQHLLIAADLANAAKAGNADAATDARRKWYQNAADIAAFLAKINPYWSQGEWRNMMFDHLKLTEDEATYRLKGQYAQDIDIYDRIEDEALKMADMMSSGISKQFRLR